MTVEKLLGLEVPPRAQVIRVIMVELQRIASHLVWLATHVLDISGTIMSLLMYCFREREQIQDVFEMCCGARLTYSYIRVGGVWKDVPPAFFPAVRNIVETFPKRFDEYEAMLTDSPLWKERVEGIGKLTAEEAIALGVTGPLLRASGVKWDLRKMQPYCGYENYDFEVPVDNAGDTYARYLVRMAEMRQSIRIIKQALDNMPDGPYISEDRKVVAPPREELDTSMEALIHHFKLWTEGFSPPPGMVYTGIENPKGELGYFLVSDGTPRPYRCRIRGPSFVNLQALPTMAKGVFVADFVAVVGTIDIVLGEVDR
jgi:NADH:ubiquinone oxidoreductase subunit D